MNINGALLQGENPLPYFRDRNHDTVINHIEPFPLEKKEKHGYETAFRVLPYRLQDRFSRKRIPMQFKSIIMENDFLKAVFLPEVGGKLISLEDKKAGRELLCRNPVFQPANLALRKAWTSGGIEWNIGQLGHTFHTCSSVFAAIVEGQDGLKFLRIYEFERCKRLFWHIDFYLPEDSQVLYAYTRVLNPNRAAISMYWWTNAAVPETPEARVFASADDVIFLDQKCVLSQKKGYGYCRMPEIPCLPGKDFSYPYICEYSTEYFFQCPPQKMQWEAVVYKEGQLYFEASTERLRYRKMFCWGSHSGGKRWQEFLAEKGTSYIEVQAGLAPSQLHGLDMPGDTIWDWTQVFGGSIVDAEEAHSRDWHKAKGYIKSRINGIITEEGINEREAIFRKNAEIMPSDIVHMGSGWGALELLQIHKKRGKAPIGLNFPISTLNEDQYPWMYLLENGVFPEKATEQLPGAWMTQEEWKQILDLSLVKEENRNWYALLHAGVMAMEYGDDVSAESFWKESIEKKASVWAYRNLSVMEKMKGNLLQTISYMERAIELPGAFYDQAIPEEFLELLKHTGRYEEAWKFYMTLPTAIQTTERIRLLAGMIAAERNDYDFIEQLFESEYACIREGETTLSDLWFKCQAYKLAKDKGVIFNAAMLEHVKKVMTPPSMLDFRVTI